jgi:8-oxo-dGTP diphosphatase
MKQLYSLGFLFNASGSRLKLIRKNRPEWQAGKLNGIGGKVEKGEHSYYAMVREFKEEAGVATEGWEHYATLQANDWEVAVYRLFDDVYYESCKSLTDEDVVSADYTDILGLDSNCISNLRWLIPLAKNLGKPKLPVLFSYNG